MKTRPFLIVAFIAAIGAMLAQAATKEEPGNRPSTRAEMTRQAQLNATARAGAARSAGIEAQEWRASNANATGFTDDEAGALRARAASAPVRIPEGLQQTNSGEQLPVIFEGHVLSGIGPAAYMTREEIDEIRREAAAATPKVPEGIQQTNTGSVESAVFEGHILTVGGRGTPGSILYAPSNYDDPNFRGLVSAACGATVDYYDARVDTPSVALLSTYDCVYTAPNYAYADNVQMGDNLAAYVDAGGKVVLGAFCTYTSFNHLSGDIMTPAYCPVVSPTGDNHFSTAAYMGDGQTCIHHHVSAYDCYYRDILVLQGAGIQDGSYDDGEIAHAYRPDFAVIYSNGAAPVCAGDWPQLICNSCSCQDSGARILYAPSQPDNLLFRAGVAAHADAIVDYFDARVATPSVALLSTYDCVFTWANYAYDDNVAFGDNLAAYVDGGGKVILGQWCLPTAGNYLDGAIMGPGYVPVSATSYTVGPISWSGSGVTCIHDDVSTYTATYRDDCTLEPGGIQDGSYTDGWLSFAYRPDFGVVYGAGITADYTSGDVDLLIANACACLGCGAPETSTCCVPSPTPSCEDAVCCASVCSYDSYCCKYSWDSACATEAAADPNCNCGPRPLQGSQPIGGGSSGSSRVWDITVPGGPDTALPAQGIFALSGLANTGAVLVGTSGNAGGGAIHILTPGGVLISSRAPTDPAVHSMAGASMAPPASAAHGFTPGHVYTTAGTPYYGVVTDSLYDIGPNGAGPDVAIGLLTDGGGTVIGGIDGLAFDPETGRLYGSTGYYAYGAPHLVEIDSTAGVTDLGNILINGAAPTGTVAGLAFSEGTLYGSLGSGVGDIIAIPPGAPQAATFDHSVTGGTDSIAGLTHGGSTCDDNVTAPLAEITLPLEMGAGCACEMVDLPVEGTASDPDGTFRDYKLEYRRVGVPGWTLISSSAEPVEADVLGLWDTTVIPQGYYVLRLTVRNWCGMANTATRSVFVKREFGTVRIDYPGDGDIVGGNICLDGTVYESWCFHVPPSNYTVDYRTAGGGPWNPVDPGNPVYTTTAVNEIFAWWNTIALAIADGDYDIRVIAEDECGETKTETITVTLDNTTPAAVITAPVNCEYVENVVQVIGTADDDNFYNWTLWYTGGPANGWVYIDSDTSPVINGVFTDWDTSALPYCAYTLRLRALDAVNLGCNTGHRHERNFYVSVNVGYCGDFDVDDDGDVDLFDFAAFMAAFTGP